MGLRMDPMGGGQFKQAVKTIIEAESQPIKNLQARKAKEEQRLKLFQDFKSKFSGIEKVLNELSDFRKFRELKVDLGDGEKYINVTVDKNRAEPGVYEIQVDELAQRTSVVSNGFEDPDEAVIGAGFVTMKLSNGEKSEIYVDEKNGSLRGIANAINNQQDSLARASVVKDSSDLDAPWKLVITAKKEGVANQVQVPEFYFLDSPDDFFIDSEREAKNAQVTFNGYPMELESNNLPEFMPGVTLQLKGARPEMPITITISEDQKKVGAKVKDLVDQINTTLKFINQQNQIDDKTDTSTTLAGDTGLQTIEYRLRNLMHEGFPVVDKDGMRFVFFNQIGVEFDKTGSLVYKEEKFTSALERDFEGVSQMVTGEFGLAKQLRSVVSSYTQSGTGSLAIREKSIRDRIKDIDRQIGDKTAILERRQQQLTDQFSKLQGTLSNLQRQGQAVAASMGGSGNLVSQLMGG